MLLTFLLFFHLYLDSIYAFLPLLSLVSAYGLATIIKIKEGKNNTLLPQMSRSQYVNQYHN
jgi:hypothetical protein